MISRINPLTQEREYLVRPQSFTLLTTPTPKGRARAMPNWEAQTLTFRTPQKTALAEADIRWRLKEEHARKYGQGVPLLVGIDFLVRRPPSAPAKRKLPVTKPDLDNFIKIKDACNGILWHDDAQVCDLIASKRYANDGEPERIVLTVYEIVFNPEG